MKWIAGAIVIAALIVSVTIVLVARNDPAPTNTTVVTECTEGTVFVPSNC